MPDVLTTLDQRWVTFASSPRGHRTLHRWQAAEPALARLPTLHALSDAARDIGGADLDARDDLHHALLRLAAVDDDARLAILHLLHPALSLAARRYSDTWPHEEAASLIITAALDRIIHYPQGLPRPAATIVRWVRRALWKEAERHRARQRALGTSCVLDEAVALPAGGDRSASDEVLDLVDQALRAGVLDRSRARLVVLHRVLSVPTAEVAETEGYPPSTIRQRRSRAEAAIAHHATKEVA